MWRFSELENLNLMLSSSLLGNYCFSMDLYVKFFVFHSGGSEKAFLYIRLEQYGLWFESLSHKLSAFYSSLLEVGFSVL